MEIIGYDGHPTKTKQNRVGATNGALNISVKGNTQANGSGDDHHLHIDSNGNARVSMVSTVSVAPANSTNSGITDDPANSVAVGVRGRTDIADASTETFISCDTAGKLQVQVVGSNDINGGTPHRHLTIDSNGRTLTAPLMTSTNTKLDHLSDDLDDVKRTKSVETPVNNESVALAGTYLSSAIDMSNVSHFGLAGTATGAFDINITVSETSGGTYYNYASGTLDSNQNIVNSSTNGVPPISPVSNFPFKFMKIQVENQDAVNPQTITLQLFKIQ